MNDSNVPFSASHRARLSVHYRDAFCDINAMDLVESLLMTTKPSDNESEAHVFAKWLKADTQIDLISDS